jgi:hypothetical protein
VGISSGTYDAVVAGTGGGRGSRAAARARRGGVAVAALAAVLLAGGCRAGTGDSGAANPGQGAKGSALAAVADLTVKGRAPKTGYSRDRFGSAWIDTDHNGCDTRDDILRRDLTSLTFRADRGGHCTVTSGVLKDPYTGHTLHYTRGHSVVDIDHVVPLSDAWQKGAAKWTLAKREQLANDPLNLLAVDGPANRSKGDGDAATWLPPNKAFRCTYVARQVAVKRKYGIWVTSAERAAMRKVLGGCPSQPLPGAGRPVVPGGPVKGATGGSSHASTAKPKATASAYANCAAARAAGAAPLHRGDPGYSRRLDRDGDGTACDS